MKHLRHLFVLFLGFLGVSCTKIAGGDNDNGKMNEMWLMYGVPTAHYSAKGYVKSSNGKPIAGIKVTPISMKAENCHYSEGISTSADGSYELKFNVTTFDGSKEDIGLVFEDIDGPQNGGEFQTDTLSVKFKKTTQGDNMWNFGTYEAKNVNIKLKNK